MLTLRPYTPDDLERLLAWRNDPATRAMSRQGHEVSRDEHAAWMEATLQDPKRVLLVIDEDGVPKGTARLDVEDGMEAEVSITVAPEARGVGLGFKALQLACDHAFDQMGVREIRAEIRAENTASIQIFTRAGFVHEGESEGFGRYRLRPPSDGEPDPEGER
ncbi:MAG: GNAT family N-acetyltransferase [Planctomycetota bacterium]|nr:GNAT family N-acetyltransferase [Planctomycetota bacterium]